MYQNLLEMMHSVLTTAPILSVPKATGVPNVLTVPNVLKMTTDNPTVPKATWYTNKNT